MDISQWWSWILSAIGIVGFVLAGKKVWWAWYINIANQIIWTAYSFITEQWGFLAATAVYLWVFSRNAYLWTKEHRNLSKSPEEVVEKTVDVGVMSPNEARKILGLASYESDPNEKDLTTLSDIIRHLRYHMKFDQAGSILISDVTLASMDRDELVILEDFLSSYSKDCGVTVERALLTNVDRGTRIRWWRE